MKSFPWGGSYFDHGILDHFTWTNSKVQVNSLGLGPKLLGNGAINWGFLKNGQRRMTCVSPRTTWGFLNPKDFPNILGTPHKEFGFRATTSQIQRGSQQENLALGPFGTLCGPTPWVSTTVWGAHPNSPLGKPLVLGRYTKTPKAPHGCCGAHQVGALHKQCCPPFQKRGGS